MSLYALEQNTIEIVTSPYKYLETANAGISLNTIYADWSITDPNAINNDTTTTPAISIVSFDVSGYYTSFSGSWFYTLNGIDYPITVLPFILSGSDTRVKFVPNTNEDGYAKFSYLPVSYYKFTEGLSSNEISTRFFKAEQLPTDLFQLGDANEYGYNTTILAHQTNYIHRNYAPQINTISINIPSTDIVKYTTDQGVSLSSIISNSNLSYIELNSLDNKGIVITGQELARNITGIWEYKTGSTWVQFDFTNSTIGYFFENSSTTFFRFYPTANDIGSSKLNFRAWDITSGSATKRTIGSSFGGENPISVNTASLNITINKVNFAPVISSTIYSLNSIYEDIPENINGGTVLDSIFFNNISYSDTTGPSQGIVIIDISNGVDTTTSTSIGKWQYANQSNVWTDISLNTNKGLHLLNNSKIRFLPSLNKNGTVSFRIRGWDQYNGLANYTIGDISGIGEYGSYSSNIATVRLNVTPVDDPPSFINPTVQLIRSYGQGVVTTDTNNTIQVVSNILSKYTYLDIDSPITNFGILITDVSIKNSTYTGDLSGFNINFYETNAWGSPNTYIRLSSIISGTNAIYISRNTNFRIATVPSDFVGELEFTFYLWDESQITNINKNTLITYNPSILTTNTAYSSNSAKFRIRYSDVNDTPILLTPLYDISLNYGTQLEDTTIYIKVPIYSSTDSKSIIRRLTITDADANTNVSIPIPGLVFYEFNPIPSSNVFNTSLVGDWYIEEQNNQIKLANLSNMNAFHVEPNQNVKLFFKPYQNIYGSFEIKARVWDRSNDVVWNNTFPSLHKTYNQLNVGELNSPYSNEILTIRVTIDNVNDPPTIESGRLFFQVDKSNANTSSGYLLSELLSTITISDPDKNNTNYGIAITFAPSTIGTFQYSISRDANNNLIWNNYIDNSDFLKGLHLKGDNITRVRFIPKETINRKTSQNVYYYLWDMTNQIENGSILPFTYVDGKISSAYSTKNYSLNIRINPT